MHKAFISKLPETLGAICDVYKINIYQIHIDTSISEASLYRINGGQQKFLNIENSLQITKKYKLSPTEQISLSPSLAAKRLKRRMKWKTENLEEILFMIQKDLAKNFAKDRKLMKAGEEN